MIEDSEVKIRFTWDIHYRCNFRCPYCWFDGKWTDMEKENGYPENPSIVDAWKKIHDRYGEVLIEISGGEPLLFPGFDSLIGRLLDYHYVIVSSNLYRPVNTVSWNKTRIRISPSLHSGQADFKVFLVNVGKLKEENILGEISYLAWPGQLGEYNRYKKIFDGMDIFFRIQPFYGTYKGKSYPDSYTRREKEIIGFNVGSRGSEKYVAEKVTRKTKICGAGHRYGVIRPDGTVFRCGGSDQVLGNIYGGEFRLKEEPYPCAVEECRCNEWALAIQEDE